MLLNAPARKIQGPPEVPCKCGASAGITLARLPRWRTYGANCSEPEPGSGDYFRYPDFRFSAIAQLPGGHLPGALGINRAGSAHSAHVMAGAAGRQTVFS